MRVKPNQDDRTAAEAVHRRFVARPEARYIASREALSHLAAVLRIHDVKSVLEFGAGIGTITYLLLTYPKPDRLVVSTESLAFCLEQLDINIPTELKSRLTVVSDGSRPDGLFDLVIIDGDVPERELDKFLRPGVICLIEGGRQTQHEGLRRLLRVKGLKCHFRYHALRHYPRLEWGRSKAGSSTSGLGFPPQRSYSLAKAAALSASFVRWLQRSVAGEVMHRFYA